MKLQITRALVDQMIAHAAQSSEIEVCGLLFGVEGKVTAAHPCRNVAADTTTSFEIDPATLIAAHKAARAGGARVIGCYHSHPNGNFALSERDTAHAEPGQIWVLIASNRVGAWLMRGGEWADFEQLT